MNSLEIFLTRQHGAPFVGDLLLRQRTAALYAYILGQDSQPANTIANCYGKID